MRWVLGHSHGISPEVEWVVVVAGHVEPVAAIAGPTQGGWVRSKLCILCFCVGCKIAIYGNAGGAIRSGVDRAAGKLLPNDLFTERLDLVRTCRGRQSHLTLDVC